VNIYNKGSKTLVQRYFALFFYILAIVCLFIPLFGLYSPVQANIFGKVLGIDAISKKVDDKSQHAMGLIAGQNAKLADFNTEVTGIKSSIGKVEFRLDKLEMKAQASVTGQAGVGNTAQNVQGDMTQTHTVSNDTSLIKYIFYIVFGFLNLLVIKLFADKKYERLSFTKDKEGMRMAHQKEVEALQRYIENLQKSKQRDQELILSIFIKLLEKQFGIDLNGNGKVSKTGG